MKLITFSFLKNLLDYKSKKKIITSNYSYIGEWCLLDDKIEDIRNENPYFVYGNEILDAFAIDQYYYKNGSHKKLFVKYPSLFFPKFFFGFLDLIGGTLVF